MEQLSSKLQEAETLVQRLRTRGEIHSLLADDVLLFKLAQ
jgi:hypothetical protein